MAIDRHRERTLRAAAGHGGRDLRFASVTRGEVEAGSNACLTLLGASAFESRAVNAPQSDSGVVRSVLNTLRKDHLLEWRPEAIKRG
jgi:hypothetical protein